MIADTFGFFGIMVLISLTIQDFKTGEVDTRINFFMKGLLLGCVFWAGLSTINLLLLALLAIMVNIFLFKDSLGAGDKSALLWVIPSFMLVSGTRPWWFYSLSFLGIFFLVLIGIYIFKRFTGAERSSAGMPLILLAFLINIMIVLVS